MDQFYRSVISSNGDTKNLLSLSENREYVPYFSMICVLVHLFTINASIFDGYQLVEIKTYKVTLTKKEFK